MGVPCPLPPGWQDPGLNEIGSVGVVLRAPAVSTSPCCPMQDHPALPAVGTSEPPALGQRRRGDCVLPWAAPRSLALGERKAAVHPTEPGLQPPPAMRRPWPFLTSCTTLSLTERRLPARPPSASTGAPFSVSAAGALGGGRGEGTQGLLCPNPLPFPAPASQATLLSVCCHLGAMGGTYPDCGWQLMGRQAECLLAVFVARRWLER